MTKNIRIRKESDGQFGYGKDENNYFGHQDGIAEKYLSKRIGKRVTGKVAISTTPEPGLTEVRMVADDSDNFRVTYPTVLRGARFCAAGIQRYTPSKFTQQKKLKLYFKVG